LNPIMPNFGILGSGGMPDLQPVIKTVAATIHIAFRTVAMWRESPQQ